MPGRWTITVAVAVLGSLIPLAHAQAREHERGARGDRGQQHQNQHQNQQQHQQQGRRDVDRHHPSNWNERRPDGHGSGERRANDGHGRYDSNRHNSPNQQRGGQWDQRPREVGRRHDNNSRNAWNDFSREHRSPVHRDYDRHRYVPRYDAPRYHRGVVRYRAPTYYYRPYGYRPYSWHVGARLPVAYYAPRYVVYDYYSYGLRRPPYGYQWVRVDHDVVLAAVTTGVVLQVVNEIFW